MPEVRRSARKRQQKIRYSTDAFEGLSPGFSISPSSESSRSDSGGEKAGSEFGPEEQSQTGAAESDASIDADSDDSELEGDESDLAADGFELDGQERHSSPRRTLESETSVIPKKPPPTGKRKKKPPPPKALHSNGILETHMRSTAKENLIIYIVGTDTEDVIALCRMRDRWINASPLPKRKPVASIGGLTPSPFYPDKKKTDEVERGLQWYYKHGGREYFKRFQRSRETADTTERDSNENTFLIGPINNPKVCKLSCGQSIALSEAWSNSTTASKRRGWIVNVGFKVQCLEWVPNRNRPSQILCVSPAEIPPPDQSEETLDGYQVPAFVAQPKRQSFMHMFEIDTSRRPGGSAPSPLKRRLTISFDWNSARRLKWCPAPMQEELDESTPQRLGFLAGVWQDGCVRVLDIHLPSLDVSHLHIEEAAFEAKPPDTICTAVAWLSTSTIAVGCANGTIAVWNLATVCASPSTRRTNPRPWLHKRLHRTLILNIATGYPSRPSFVFTNSIDGTARQTDLRDPRADRAAAQRARVYQAPLAWCDGGQFAAAADDGHLVKALFLRYFHGSRMLSRADALVLDVAASPLHGALLAGAADGSVAAVNAVRRAMVYKSDAASRMTWFRYEWRGPVEGRGEEGGAADEILKKPLGRFVEGFKVISSVLSEEKLTKNGNPKFTVVYEENSAVNRVSWNTNLVSGTWAAAATVSGLIRIEDLALD